MISEDKVINTILEVVSDVLEYDIDELDTQSKLVTDLGADSLDIVDLSFSLGKAFGIKMPQKNIISSAEEALGDLSKVLDGDKLTVLGAHILCVGPNAYSKHEVFAGQSLVTVFSETTIGHWVNLCRYIIDSGLPGDDAIKQCVCNILADNPFGQVAC